MTAEGGTAQDGTAQDGAPQDGTAQDGTAQDGTAQDGTGPGGAAHAGPIASVRGWYARLGIRTRLVLNVAVAMAVVLLATSAFVFWRVAHALDRQLDADLRAYHDVVVTAVRTADEMPPRTAGRWYEVLDSGARVTLASKELDGRELLPPAPFARALSGVRVTYDHGSLLPPDPSAFRTLATSVRTPAGAVVVATAISRQPRDEALHELLLQLAIADILVLLAAAYVGYRTTRGALDPVERYRAAAAQATPGSRMPVSADRDDELTRLGRTLNDLLDRIEESVAREHRFIADAAHELRTPLALLKAEVELALHRPRTAEYSRRTLESISAEVDRLVELSNALLDLEEITSATVAPMEPVPVAELLDGVADRHRHALESTGRAVVVAAPDDLVAAMNRRWVESALDNLVGNATRYGAGTVTLEAVAEPGGIELSVSDQGAGFSDEIREHAFERFARADAARSTRGSGLGLALVRAVCLAHDGQPRIDQAPGRTTVTMTLRRPGAIPAGATASGAASGGGGWSSGAVALPLPVGQPGQHDVEAGQRDQAGGRVAGDQEELVADERDEEGQHPGVGPQLLAQHGDDEDDLRQAVGEQVEPGEAQPRVGEGVGGGPVQQPGGDEVVGVLGELAVRQAGQPSGELLAGDQ